MEKNLKNIERNSNVSFCVVDNVETLTDKLSTKYRSVIEKLKRSWQRKARYLEVFLKNTHWIS